MESTRISLDDRRSSLLCLSQQSEDQQRLEPKQSFARLAMQALHHCMLSPIYTSPTGLTLAKPHVTLYQQNPM